MTFEQAWPVIGTVVGGAAAYFGALSAVREAIARVEERLKAVEKRVDSDHAQLEALETAVYRQVKS